MRGADESRKRRRRQFPSEFTSEDEEGVRREDEMTRRQFPSGRRKGRRERGKEKEDKRRGRNSSSLRWEKGMGGE